jgi:8-oxo-dGTP diphosphatase
MTEVTCALIVEDGKVLVTQRSEQMPHPLKWEFPGGKVKEGESPESCISREILEEIGLKIRLGLQLPQVKFTYKSGSIKLIPFVCSVVGGTVSLAEHKACRWVPFREMEKLDWLEADVEVVQMFLTWINEAAGQSSTLPG